MADTIAGADEDWAVVSSEHRKSARVTFEHGIDVYMMAIDGTWRRDCSMEDVSATGARLTVHQPIQGLHIKEFFLLLSSTGLAYRRCELAWVNGDQLGARFVTNSTKKNPRKLAKQVDV